MKSLPLLLAMMVASRGAFPGEPTEGRRLRDELLKFPQEQIDTGEMVSKTCVPACGNMVLTGPEAPK